MPRLTEAERTRRAILFDIGLHAQSDVFNAMAAVDDYGAAIDWERGFRHYLKTAAKRGERIIRLRRKRAAISEGKPGAGKDAGRRLLSVTPEA